jgi:hypothetical protein
MVDLELLLNDLIRGSDRLDDYGRCEATTRLLCATARRYNNIYTEFERLKESTCFNKPFPILRLPREIRDEIYTYALRADISVDVNPQFNCTLATENPFKPATPGLLRINKQTYQEAIEILYSKNMFKFQYSRQLFAFEEQIRLENCKRMRNICIWIRYPEYQEVVRDSRNLLPSEYDSVPIHWIATLKACGLKNITHLTVEAETISGDALSLLPMPRDLQKSIEQFLERGANDIAPRLSLTGNCRGSVEVL